MKKFIEFFCTQTGLTVYLLAVTIGLIIAIFFFWPTDIPSKSRQNAKSSFAIKDTISKIRIDGTFKPEISTVLKDTSTLSISITSSNQSVQKSEIPLTPSNNPLDEKSLLLLILLIGALGSSLHGLVSISNYVGNRTFVPSWALWYGLRPFVGAILSLIFYLVIRAGFYKEFDTGFYTILALSGLIGLFSKQALNKLSELFDFIFKSDKDKDLKGKMHIHPKPKIDDIQLLNNSEDIVITIIGSGFINESVIRCNNIEYQPTFQCTDKISFKITGSELLNIRGKEVSVLAFNPPPEGGLSETRTINIPQKI